MNRISKWVVALSSVAIGAAALAADPSPQPQPTPQKTDTPATAPAATRRPRLILPWSQLTDLTDEQKTKILAIISSTNEQLAAVRLKERTDITALLTEDQKKKAEEIDANRPRRGRRGAASSTGRAVARGFI